MTDALPTDALPTDGPPPDGPPALSPTSLGFRAFLTTQFLGAFNDNAFRFTLIFYVLAAVQGDEEQGRWLGLNQALFAVPFIVFASLAGSLADRWSKTGIIRGSKLLEIVVMAAGLAAFLADSLAGLTAVLFLMAAQSAFFGPGKYGLLAETLKEGDLVRANALVQLTTMLAIVGGQLVGGMLYDAYQGDLAGAAVWFVSFAVVGTLTSFGVPRVPAARPEEPVVWNPLPDLMGTWRGVYGDRTLLYTMLGNAHYFLLVAALQINLAAYGQDGLGMDERAGAAALVATASLGLGVGALLASRWSDGRVELGLVPLGALAMSVGLVLVALVDPAPLAWLPASWEHLVDPVQEVIPHGASPAGEHGLMGAALAKLQAAAFALVNQGLWAPFAATALLGLAGGLYLVPIMSLLQTFAPAKEKGRYLAFSNMVGFVGIALSAGLLYVPRALGIGFSGQFLILAAIAFLGAVVCLRLLPFAFVRLVGWLLAHTLYRIRVLHAERLPEEGGALLLVNHVSWVDALVLGTSTRRKVHFLMYRAYYDWWPTRWLFRLVGCIPVASGDQPEVTAASLRAAGELLEEGRVVAVFGEGAVTRLGHLLPFRTGYQRIIEGRDVPIVPVYLGGLWGSVLSHRGGRFLRRLPRLSPRRVTVAFGDPMPPHTSPGAARSAIQAVAAESWQLQERTPLTLACARARRRGRARRFVDDSGKRHGTARLWADAGALARALERQLAPGARVALDATPSMASAVSVLALMRAGRVPVLVAPSHDETARREVACVAGAGAWLGSDGVLEPLAPGSPARATEGVESGAADVLDAEVAVVFDADGSPRALTQRQISAQVDGLRQVFDLGEADVLLGAEPWSSALGLCTGLWFPLLGSVDAAWTGEQDGRALGRFIERQRASLAFITPARLEAWHAAVRPASLGGLTQLYVVGAARDDAGAAAFAERFGLEPQWGWAPDSCAGLAALNTPDVRLPGVFQRGTRAGTLGHPLPGLHITAEHEDGAPCPPGVEGRLRVEGPVVGAALGSADASGLVCGRGSVDDEGFVTVTD